MTHEFLWDMDIHMDHLISARELKKKWHMKVTIVPIVIVAFDTETKGLLKSLEDL